MKSKEEIDELAEILTEDLEESDIEINKERLNKE